ncbi:MAG: hypothetical protein V3S13_00205 [Candidatus Omnitrophota bacterium]
MIGNKVSNKMGAKNLRDFLNPFMSSLKKHISYNNMATGRVIDVGFVKEQRTIDTKLTT